jgi:low temperature requirement protein LtrA
MAVDHAAHRLRRMSGRDPHEVHRAATPLELLYDLTFVVAFGAAGNELAHALAEDHVGSGLAAFGLSVFAICWAWINFTWFASAYDTDDWAFRLLTMVQMAGVIILALGLPQVFESIAEGRDVRNDVMVVGYVVMRVPMVVLWLRAARQDAGRRRACRTYVVTILVAQVLWCALLVPDLTVRAFFGLGLIPVAVELAGPIVAEARHGGTPWHPHHIAERYGLLAIITLGEGVIGTVAALSAHVNDPELGWTSEAVVLLGAGIGLTFGMWWVYFAIPWPELLHHHRERSFFWGYGHMVIFGSIAATGAGLHTVQYFLEHHSELGKTGTLLTVVIPVAAYIGMIYLMYAVSMRATDPFHLLLLAGSAAVLIGAAVLSTTGVSLSVCLVLVALAPVVTIVGYETVGHRHGQDHLEHLRATSRDR